MTAPNVIPMKPANTVEMAFKYPTTWRFCVIRGGSKSPSLPGWNESRNAFVPTQLDPGTAGIGLLHRWSETCALDLDAMDEARLWLAERGIDLDALLNADDAVQILSGREGKGKLIYQLPAGKVLETRKIVKDMTTVLEFRSSDKGGKSVQCCLPPTIHPVTCQPYTWGGKGHYSALPTIPEALLTVWEAVIEADKVPRVNIRGEYSASAEEIGSAVAFCDPDSDRTPWVQVGMALKLELGDAGCQIWDEWSQKSSKYPGEREMAAQWRSFKNDHPNPVTVGTIFHHARANGWQRPAPDLLRLFNAGNIKMPGELLSDLFPPVPPINLELLPPVLARYAAEVAQSVGCDPIVPALAGMGAICGAINACSRIRIKKDWDEPPILWLLTHGMPADKKTPGSRPMLRVLSDIEREDRDRFKLDMVRWEAEEAAHAAAKKDLMAKSATADHAMATQDGDILAGLPQLPKLRPQPLPLMILLKDTTSQAAAREAIARPEGMLLHKDEMADWLQRVADPRSGENKSFYVESYEGNPYRHTRIGKGNGEGNYETDNLAISVYGNVQPDVLREAAPTITKDGMRARFIVGVLNTELTTVSSEFDLPEFLSGKGKYEQMIRHVRAQAATEYVLAPEAYRTFRRWEGDVIEHGKALKRLGRSSFLQGLVGKGQGLAGRTTLVFHAAENPAERVVSDDTVRRAVAFLREFVIPHAVHVDQQCEAASLERWVINRIVKLSDKERVSLSELVRAANRPLGLKADTRVMEDRVRSIMGLVAEAGWVVLVRDDAKSTAWNINPRLNNLFLSERAAMLLEDANFKQEIVSSRDNKD